MMTPVPHHTMPPGVAMTVSDHSTDYAQYPHLPSDCGPSPFLPEDTSPYGMPPQLPMHGNVSPLMGHMDATRYHGADFHRIHVPMHPQAVMHFPQPRLRASSASGPARPPLHRGHTTLAVPPRPQTLHRQASLQVPPARSASPHMMAGDLFDPMPGSPIKRASSSLGIPMEHNQHQMYAPQDPVSIRLLL